MWVGREADGLATQPRRGGVEQPAAARGAIAAIPLDGRRRRTEDGSRSPWTRGVSKEDGGARASSGGLLSLRCFDETATVRIGRSAMAMRCHTRGVVSFVNGRAARSRQRKGLAGVLRLGAEDCLTQDGTMGTSKNASFGSKSRVSLRTSQVRIIGYSSVRVSELFSRS